MKTLPHSASVLIARMVQALRSLQVSLMAWAPRPAPVLVPMPVRVDCGRHESIQLRRHRGF